jgi:putative endonuclease
MERAAAMLSHLHGAFLLRYSYNLPVHHIYILRCADGTLYTGYALDPAAREQLHNQGRGAKYTRSRRPVALVYSESFPTKSEALKRELLLKRLPRSRKEALIAVSEATRRPRPE